MNGSTAGRLAGWIAAALTILQSAAARGEPTMPTVVFPDEGRVEIALYPAVIELNADLTRELATGGAVTWHLTEGFALQARYGQRVWAWLTYYDELVNLIRPEEPLTTPAQRWSALVGTEVTPLERTGMFLSTPAGFELIVCGGLGAVNLEYGVLRGGTPARIDPWLDTGARFAIGVGLGARVKLGNHLSIRLEVTDVMSSATVDTVEGCNAEDLAAFDRQLRQGGPIAGPVSSGCDLAFFQQNELQIMEANSLVRFGSEAWLQAISAQLGVSVVF